MRRADTDRSRPAGNGTASKITGGRSSSSVDASGDTPVERHHSPSWDDYVAATCAAQAEGYRLGFHAGLKYAADEADGKVLRERAAEVVLNAAKDMHVAALRRPAA